MERPLSSADSEASAGHPVEGANRCAHRLGHADIGGACDCAASRAGAKLLGPGGLAAVGLPEAGAGCRIPPCTTRLQMAVRCGPLAGIAYRGVSGAEKGQEWRGCGGPAPACMKPMRPWQGNWRGAGGVRGEQSHCGRTTHGPGFRRSSPPTGLGLELELEVSSPNRRGQVQDSCAYELEPGIDTRSSS